MIAHQTTVGNEEGPMKILGTLIQEPPIFIRTFSPISIRKMDLDPDRDAGYCFFSH